MIAANTTLKQTKAYAAYSLYLMVRGEYLTNVVSEGADRARLNSQGIKRTSPMRATDKSRLSGFASKTAGLASDFGRVIRHLIRDVRDSYRREPRHLRAVRVASRSRHRR